MENETKFISERCPMCTSTIHEYVKIAIENNNKAIFDCPRCGKKLALEWDKSLGRYVIVPQ